MKDKSVAYETGVPPIFWCPHCGKDAAYPVPVEPLYFLADVYKLIPFSTFESAKKFLWRRRKDFPPQYIRVEGGRARYKRVLTARDVQKLRAERLYPLRLMNRSKERKERYED
jgi:hypothetical protein